MPMGLPRAPGLLRRTAPRNDRPFDSTQDRRGVPLLAKTTPIAFFGWRFILDKDGSSGNRVGAWEDLGGSQGSPLPPIVTVGGRGVGREKEAQALDASPPPLLPLLT